MTHLLSLHALCWIVFLVAILPGCAITTAQQQRAAVAWIESCNGRVVYDYQSKNLKPVNVWYTTGSEEDKAQFQSRLPEDTWLAKTLGRDYAYRVEDVSFYEAKFEGDVSLLAQAKGLKRLSIADCEISEALLSAIGRCSDLERLRISDCRFTSDASFVHVAQLRKLNELCLDRISLTAIALKHIGQCHQLESLDLTYCDFDPTQVEHLCGLTKLKHCGLGFTSVGDEQLKILRHFPNLKRLEVGSKVTDAGMVEVAQVKSLEAIVFMESQVTDAGLEHIITLPHLKSVQAGTCRFSREMWQRLVTAHPGMYTESAP